MRRHAEILKRSDANLPRVFGVLPRIPYELKEMEPFRCKAAPEAYYYNAPDDGSRPAYFYVNTCDPTTRPIYTMEALAYHEAQPGHHLQLALAQEKKGWPMFRRFESITAYIEGWALYSELLGYDLGGYKDPYSRLGQLTYDTWRSSRLVVDTGMHYFGWTRDKAIQFMKDNTALSEQNIVSEVDRYIAWPGQALAYKIGQLEILKLRREAEQRLQRKFDIRAFHDHVLAEGSLPLHTLRERMMRWIEDRKGGNQR
jgi:prolyl oligopeptidase